MIHSQFGNETDGWVRNGLMGAVSDEEDKIHLTIHEQTSCGEKVAVSDLTIDTTFAMNVGQCLGLPVEVAKCIKHICNPNILRLFSFSGCTHGDWIIARERLFKGTHRRF